MQTVENGLVSQNEHKNEGPTTNESESIAKKRNAFIKRTQFMSSEYSVHFSSMESCSAERLSVFIRFDDNSI